MVSLGVHQRSYSLLFSYSPQHTLQIDTMVLIPEILDIFFNTEVDLTIGGVFPFIHYTHRVVKFTAFNAYPQYKASYLNDSQIDWLYNNSSTSTGQDSHSVHQTSNMPARQSGWRVCLDMKFHLCAANIRTRICNLMDKFSHAVSNHNHFRIPF